ncbi:helix-turn-helix transcriptional regulator [Streptomyces sp. NPDC048279]|uniref:helix-turn-helix domain-containing protein n=1 Tax=Streptomyces sp. NPDC048279 TaxID=3154714 RepID=UPI0034452D63
MSSQPRDHAPVIPLRPRQPDPEPREPLWRDLVGDVLRRERLDQERTLKEVAETARISLPYLSEIERGRKEASSEVLAAAAHALGLDLGNLLSLVHSEFARQTAAGRPAPYNGLCLVA